jgi:hypothetical protein
MDMDTDAQRRLAQALYAGSLAPVVDKGAKTAWFQATGVVCQRLHASSPLLQLGQHGDVQACIRQSKQLSVCAQVSHTFHAELQAYRREQAAALVAEFVELAPPQALELINICNYHPEDWTRAPDVSLLNFDVYLGSRLQLAICCKRQRVQSSPQAEQELLIQLAVAERTDGQPSRSPEFRIQPHELCSKSGYHFEDWDTEAYDVWYQQKRTHIQHWLSAQFAALSAPL